MRVKDCASMGNFLTPQGLRAAGESADPLTTMRDDTFDDFELLILVHEATADHKKEKIKTLIRVVAGNQVVDTDPSSRGIFQQPLHVFVEQGTSKVVMELLEEPSHKLLASREFDPLTDILESKLQDKEQNIQMHVRAKGIQNPKLKMMMVVSHDHDVETGLLGSGMDGMSEDTKILMQQQLRKADHRPASRGVSGYEAAGDQPLSETQRLKQACAGPLDLFEGFGAMRRKSSLRVRRPSWK